MSKFVTLSEAAEQLGISQDEVNELRLRGDLYGYRDGTSWKFKPEDITRIGEKRSGGSGGRCRSLRRFRDGRLARD